MNRPPISRYRRAFTFNTHEATGYAVVHKGKRRFLRIPHEKHSREYARDQFVIMKLFHLLYPHHAIVPVSPAYIEMTGSKQWGVVSEILKNRSSTYKQYQQFFYGARKDNPAVVEHQKFVADIGMRKAHEINQESGFMVNDHPVNIAAVNGVPVFLEVDIQEGGFGRMEAIIRSRLSGSVQKQAQALLAQAKARHNA